MRPASELKQDLEVQNSLGDIVDVLKTAAMIQLRTFQSAHHLNLEYGRRASAAVSAAAALQSSHAYAFDRKSLPSAIVIMTSDEGFLGELNALLIGAAVEMRRSASDCLVVLGDRGAHALEEAEETFEYLPGIGDEVHYDVTRPLREYLLEGYRRRFGRILLVYPEFISLTVQRVQRVTLLPVEPAPASAPEPQAEAPLFEPTVRRAFESAVETWFGYRLFEIFLSSKQAELAARIMHLESSTHELGAINQKLSHEYFRQVHRMKDKVIREISASKVMLQRKRRREAARG